LVYALLLEGNNISVERATIPNRPEAISKLAKRLSAKYQTVKACYEAAFNGYHLQR